jgi:hypothetical protein
MRELETTIRLLEADLAATQLAQHQAWVRDRAKTVAELDIDDKAEKLVADVQDCILEHAKSVWPVCPRHSHHPLWMRDHAWRCDADSSIVVPLGALGSLKRGDATS